MDVTITEQTRLDGRTVFVVEQWRNPWGGESGRYAWETFRTTSRAKAERTARRWRATLERSTAAAQARTIPHAGTYITREEADRISRDGP